MTIEEMDAEIAHVKAFLKKSCQDWIVELTEELATEKNPYRRERLIKSIEEHQQGLASGKYD